MQKGLSATKLVEKASQEEANNSVIPDWVFQLGGATLVLGGLGYLWYRRRIIRAYNQLTDEKFSKLYLQMENRGLQFRIWIFRTVLSKIMADFRLSNLGRKFNIREEKTKDLFGQVITKQNEKNVQPVIDIVLRFSEHSQLTLNLFNKKKEVIENQIKEKAEQGIALSSAEKMVKNLSSMVSDLNQGFFVQAFQELDLGDQTEGLNHKECLQCLLDYEADTIISYLNLYQTMVSRDRNPDLDRRIEAFVSIMEPRMRMEALKSFATQKLRTGGRYFELPEEERYDPLILFLSVALDPPQKDIYDVYARGKIIDFFHNMIFERQAFIQLFITRVAEPSPLKNLLPFLRGHLKHPSVVELLEENGLTFDPYKDFD